MIKFDQLQVRYAYMDVACKDVLLYFGKDLSNIKPDELFSMYICQVYVRLRGKNILFCDMKLITISISSLPEKIS